MTRHPMSEFRRFVAEVAVLHAFFGGGWLLTPATDRPVVERWATMTAMGLAGLYFLGLAVAFLWARKSRLNLAFAIQKCYWFLLVAMLAFPLQAGLIVHHAPYQANPYALWAPPGWLRTYIWVFLSIATMSVAREFFAANNLHPIEAVWRSRRRNKRFAEG